MQRTNSGTILTWLKGRNEYRPAIVVLALIIFSLIYLLPTPAGVTELLRTPNPAGYATKPGYTIVDNLAESFHDPGLSLQEVERKIKATLGILVLAAILWSTIALPIGATGFCVAMLLYIFRVIPINTIAKSYMNDAVFFLLGSLAMAVGMEKTGLDRRIGFLFLGWTKNRKSFLFIFGPLIALATVFISARCLIAFLMPVMMRLYKNAVKSHGLKQHPDLALFLILTLIYMTSNAGPGAPTAGAAHALTIGFFEAWGKPMSFVQWLKYGLPFVPVGTLAMGAYLYLVFNKKIKLRINPSKRVKEETKTLGRYSGKEVLLTAILLLVIFLWITQSSTLGLGGPTIIGLVLMFVSGIVGWEDLNQKIAWGVVWMYAAACSVGYVLLITGTATWLATTVFELLPSAIKMKDGLLISISAITSILTNIMSSGAAVAVIAPIALPMSEMSRLSVWEIGLAISFSSSFAYCLIIGRPALAIAYALARDPDTGERLITAGQLVKYGLPATIIAWLVLWLWTFLGYWKILTF